MTSDFSQTKIYKSRTQPNEEVEHPSEQPCQRYNNPIIKHTFESLPGIYGSHPNRKRKYNMFMKNKLELNSIISRSNTKSTHPDQKCYNRPNQLDQYKQRGQSCLDMNKLRQQQHQQRQQITKTVVKHSKHTSKSPDQLLNNEQLKSQCTATPKNKRLVNLQLMHSLSKPKQNCSKQYCSCKSLFKQYKQEIQKKLKQKKSHNAYRRHNSSKIQLPRLSVELNKRSPPKLDDQESRHKVNFRYSQQKNQQTDTCCVMCSKSKKSDSLELKGLLGLIHKKQLEQKKKKLTHQSNTQNIGIQSDVQIMTESKIQDFGIQADLITTKKKLSTIDQQINTEFQDENKDYKYLQNNRSLKESSTKQKKQPLEHLSHLKEIYKHKKKPIYESKHGENQDRHQNCECDNNDSDEKISGKKHKKSQLKRTKKGKPAQYEEQVQINMQSESAMSAMSENSLINHLTKALSTSKNDRSTIFKALKKREIEESESEAARSSSKSKKYSKSKSKYKNMNLIDEGTGLFAIPEEQEYVDYLKSYKPISKDFKIKSLIKSENFKILKYNDTLYFGETDAENKKHGQALFISPKQIFEGVYQNGIKMSGCERNIDGVYIGQFMNGQRHGNGKWLWNNGQVYEGEWRLGTKNGHGIWKSPKGDSYEGDWLLNRQQGNGIHRHKSSVYEGQFVQSLKSGKGKQKFINGDYYVGQYLRGKPHGSGRYTWKNGNYYEGDFKNGLRQGFGKWHFSPKAYYEGQFKGDFKHGRGKQHFENGDEYEGQYYEGVKTKGIMIQSITNKVTKIKNNSNVKIYENKQKENQKQESNLERFLKDSKVNKKQKKPEIEVENQQKSSQFEQQQDKQGIIEDKKIEDKEQSDYQDEIHLELKSQVENEA